MNVFCRLITKQDSSWSLGKSGENVMLLYYYIHSHTGAVPSGECKSVVVRGRYGIQTMVQSGRQESSMGVDARYSYPRQAGDAVEVTKYGSIRYRDRADIW